MRLRPADNIEQFAEIAKEYHGDKLTNISEGEMNGKKTITMEKDLGRESKIFKMCYKAKIAFYAMKFNFYDMKLGLYKKMTNALNFFGVKNDLLNVKAEALKEEALADQKLANDDRNVAIGDLAKAQINKRIVTIVLKNDEENSQVKILKAINELKFNSAHESDREAKLDICLLLVDNCIVLEDAAGAEGWLNKASIAEKKATANEQVKKNIAGKYVQLAKIHDSNVLTKDYDHSKIYDLYTKAMDYDPKNSDILLKLGFYNLWGAPRYTGIEKNFQKSADYFSQLIDLNPNKEQGYGKKVIKDIMYTINIYSNCYRESSLSKEQIIELLNMIKNNITDVALIKEIDDETLAIRNS